MPALALSLLLATVPLPVDVIVDAGRGPVVVRVPSAHVPGAPSPLVLFLHGYTTDPAQADAAYDLGPLLEEYGLLYAKPTGPIDSFGVHYWNATSACCDFLGVGTDDSTYLAALIDSIAQAVDVDARRIYVIGQSNGGFMAHRLACDHSDQLAAIVCVSGGGLLPSAPCSAVQPVSVLALHGTQDTFIQYAGGVLGGNPYPSVRETFDLLAQRYGCLGGPTAPGVSFDVDEHIQGPEAVAERYWFCQSEAEVELWSLVGSGHGIDPSPAATRRILEWLLAHARPGLDQTSYCAPAPLNSAGTPAHIRALGSDVLARNDLRLAVEALPSGVPVRCMASLEAAQIPFPGATPGARCVGPNTARLPGGGMLLASGSGLVALTVDLTRLPVPLGASTASGATWHFQAWYRDGATSVLTDAVAVLLR